MYYLLVNSGIGALDLALQRLHFWRPVCYVELHPSNIAILEQRFREDAIRNAPIWDDFLTFDGNPWRGCVDCVAGVEARNNASNEDASSKTYSDALIRVVKEVGASHIFWQLAPTSKSKAITNADYLTNGLEICGYRTAIFKVRAGDMGADHRRTRIFICAEMEDSNTEERGDDGDECFIESRLSTPCRATRWTSAPRLCRRTDGIANRMERLESIGQCEIPAMVAAVSTILDGGIVF